MSAQRITTAILSAALTATGGAAPVDLQVRRIALFSSGVGYYECEAAVTDSAVAELSFRTAQINDIIKSLVVQDHDGGSVSVVSYASRDPIEKSLRSFGVDITGKPTLAQLLDQLRGEPVEIAAPRAAKGVILGVEKQKIMHENQVIEIDVLNVLTDAGIQQLRLNELGGLKLTNEKVAGELRKALATLATGHDADKKSVGIRFDGKGQRRVRVGYLLEAPVWKTSYRLVLSPEKKPFLQGWATVENTTEEDWKDVQLSLVSGRPISFRMDLYTPLYVPRPLETLELYASLRPPEYEGAFAMGEDEDQADREAGKALALKKELAEKARAPGAPAPMQSRAADAAPRAGGAGGRFGGEAGFAGREVVDANAMGLQDAGVESVAAAQEAGELYEYAIRTPVSIPRQHSAMLPIVNDAVEGEKVSVYNPATHARHPLNALQLTNTSGLHLMQGPVTLFDGNVYAGDAKLPDLKPGEKRLIAYALDLATEVMIKQEAKPEELVSLRIAKGTLGFTRKFIDAREYVIKNKDDKERIVLVEQPYGDEWKLKEPKEPYERTHSLSRFKVAVGGGKTASQKVVLEQVAEAWVSLGDLGLDQVRFYINTKVITAKVKEALERVIALRTDLDSASRGRQNTENGYNEAVKEQGRIRENIKSLDKGSDTYQRQLAKFDSLETEIEKLRDALAKARTEEENRRNALQSYLLALNVE
jgi:hypothetical protein